MKGRATHLLTFLRQPGLAHPEDNRADDSSENENNGVSESVKPNERLQFEGPRR